MQLYMSKPKIKSVKVFIASKTLFEKLEKEEEERIYNSPFSETRFLIPNNNCD